MIQSFVVLENIPTAYGDIIHGENLTAHMPAPMRQREERPGNRRKRTMCDGSTWSRCKSKQLVHICDIKSGAQGSLKSSEDLLMG